MAHVRPVVVSPPALVRVRSHTGPWAILALAFFAAVLVYSAVIHFTTPVYPEDDAFIIYRYVDNLVAGRGLVYNEGQKVYGASTPLYVAGLALAKLILRPVPTPDLAVRLNFIAYLAAGLGFFLLLRRLTGHLAFSAALSGLLFLRDDMLRVSTGGMESFLFVALMLWALWALSGRRFVLAAVLAGLSVLVRIEGVLLAALVFAGWLIADRRHVLAVLLGLFLPGLAWIGFGFAYYGTPVYHSIIAKSRPVYPLSFGDAIVRIWNRVLGNLTLWPPADDTVKWHHAVRVVASLVLAGLALLGYAVSRRNRPAELKAQGRGASAVVLLLLLFLLLYLVTNPLMFPWYYPPLIVLWQLAIVVGIGRIGSRRRLVLILLTTFFAVTALAAPFTRVVAGKPVADIGVASDPVRTRVVAYRNAAEWLNQVLPSGVPIVGPEVGSLGYYYQGPVIDACGLVSPEALPFLPVPLSERFSADCGAISVEMVRSLEPDVVVTMGTFAGISLYDDPWFRQGYIKVRMFDLPIPAWNTPTVDVFFRADRVSR